MRLIKLYLSLVLLIILLGCNPSIKNFGNLGNSVPGTAINRYASPYSNTIHPINKKNFNESIDTVDSFFTRKFNVDQDMLYMATLHQYGNKIKGATQVQPSGGGILVKVSPPSTGNYKLNIFGRPKSESGSFSGIYYWEFNVKNFIGKSKRFSDYLGKDDYIIDYDIENIAKNRSKYDYSKIDRYTKEVLDKYEKSIPELTNYLISKAKNELEKVRAIFNWLISNISYDDDAYYSGNIKEAADYWNAFQARKAVCSGYAGLFNKMAEVAGLKSTVISGFGKGISYYKKEALGKYRKGNLSSNHVWNAVEINGKWYLLDATWGRGDLTYNGQKVIYDNYFYFLTPPKEMIYDHYPFNEKYQFLDETITMEDFFQKPEDSQNKRKYLKNYIEKNLSGIR